MALFDFFKKKPIQRIIEQAVIINFKYGKTDLSDLFSLENRLEDFLKDKNIGDLDGHEIAVDGSDGFLYLYGNNAQLLFDTIIPILKEAPFMEKAKIHLRFGDVNDINTKTINFILE